MGLLGTTTCGVRALSAQRSVFAGRALPQAAVPAAGCGRRSAAVMMAGKKKDTRITITLECTEQKAEGVPGISRYTTMKNRKNTPNRLELMKYNKYLRRMTLHRELKK